MMTESKIKRVYIDGIFDMFHRGHVESFRKAKEFCNGPTQLIVGVISDEDATSYKRKPIYNEEDRYELVKSCKYVDEVILRAPLIMNKEFINRHKIDCVVHGFSDFKDAQKQKKFYEQVADIFYEIPYYKHASTTDIISSIIEQYPNHNTQPITQSITQSITQPMTQSKVSTMADTILDIDTISDTISDTNIV